MKWDAELAGGILLFSPISKELTPFILEQISHLTHGKSLKAIIELVINNAQLAGKIAKLSSLRYNLNSRDNTDDK